MNSTFSTLLSEILVCLADDELILGHRNSEWCGQAPILEEDIAFANIALDEIGHASLWYQLAANLTGKNAERYPDQMVYFRTANEFSSIQMVELPVGDWAFTILRQYLFDAAESLRLEALTNSSNKELAAVSTKILHEEIYHLRHTQAWILRLGLGTSQSNQRMQSALDELWQYSTQLFSPFSQEEILVKEKIWPSSRELRMQWEDLVKPSLAQAELIVPDTTNKAPDRSEHTPYLISLLGEMQSVTRADPFAIW